MFFKGDKLIYVMQKFKKNLLICYKLRPLDNFTSANHSPQQVFAKAVELIFVNTLTETSVKYI